MLKKNYAIFRKKFCTTLVVAVLALVVIVSCSEKKDPEFDPLNLPVAYCSYEIQYKAHTDGKMYAFVTVHNHSIYSNRWEWSRPGSVEEISGDIELSNDEKTDILTAYLATDEEQHFEITLIAYSDMPTMKPTDTVLQYKTYKSEPFVQEIKVKKPEIDPLTLPVADFFYEIQYGMHPTDSLNTYAFVTAHNNSANSNQWKWNRPNSKEAISGKSEFMTDKDTAVTQAYLATKDEQRFNVTLIAYRYTPIGSNPNETTNYEVFESYPLMQEIIVKKPE